MTEYVLVHVSTELSTTRESSSVSTFCALVPAASDPELLGRLRAWNGLFSNEIQLEEEADKALYRALCRMDSWEGTFPGSRGAIVYMQCRPSGPSLTLAPRERVVELIFLTLDLSRCLAIDPANPVSLAEQRAKNKGRW